MRPTAIIALILIAGFAPPSFAQAPDSAPPTRIRGTIEKFADHTLTVKARDGDLTTVSLAPDFTVRAVVAKTLDDIKPGDKVGITSVKSPDGTRQAIEIHIFPASMTTVRLFEAPWDRGTGSLMTNAQVAEVTSAPQGGKINITLNAKSTEISVPPGTPIVTYAPGDPALLKPGAAVFVIARKQPDGSLAAAGVTAEKDGVKPPM
jgi:hypothetical protein